MVPPEDHGDQDEYPSGDVRPGAGGGIDEHAERHGQDGRQRKGPEHGVGHIPAVGPRHGDRADEVEAQADDDEGLAQGHQDVPWQGAGKQSRPPGVPGSRRARQHCGRSRNKDGREEPTLIWPHSPEYPRWIKIG